MTKREIRNALMDLLAERESYPFWAQADAILAEFDVREQEH